MPKGLWYHRRTEKADWGGSVLKGAVVHCVILLGGSEPSRTPSYLQGRVRVCCSWLVVSQERGSDSSLDHITSLRHGG